MSMPRAARTRLRTVCSLGMIAAGLALLPVLASAQDPAGQPPAQGGQGGRQGRRGQGGPGGPGGFGNFAGRMPFASGQVTGGDPASGTIIIASPFGGSQTIKVSPDTKYVALVQIDVSKLQVGDTVQVQGVPKEITANTITAGEMPDFLRPNRGGPGGAPGATGAAGTAGGGAVAQGNGVPARQQQQAFASASGKVSKLEPLTIDMSSEVSIVLKMGPNAKIMKLMPATINNIKLGDTVSAAGTANQDGTFIATGVGVNINQMGGMGGRGFGGPGGRGGFGGPGGPGFNGAGGQGGAGGAGATGFGGRRGRGGRGGQGGAGGGAGA